MYLGIKDGHLQSTHFCINVTSFIELESSDLEAPLYCQAHRNDCQLYGALYKNAK